MGREKETETANPGDSSNWDGERVHMALHSRFLRPLKSPLLIGRAHLDTNPRNARGSQGKANSFSDKATVTAKRRWSFISGIKEFSRKEAVLRSCSIMRKFRP